MRTLRKLSIGVARSALWPAYLGMLAYAIRQGPWPKTLALPAALAVAGLALALLAANLVRRLFGPAGWAEDVLEMPREVGLRLRRASVALIVAAVAFLLPAWCLHLGLIAPAGRPVWAPAVARLFTLGFESAVLAITWWAFRRRSPLVDWLTQAHSSGRLGRMARHQRELSAAAIAGVVAVIVLDVRGYSFSAHQLASGASGSLLIVAACWGFYRALLRFIDDHAWQWIRRGKSLSGSRRGQPDVDASVMPDDLAGRLRQLSGYLTVAVGLVLGAWVWDIDLALFRFIGEQPLWESGIVAGKPAFVHVGELARALAIAALCAAAWRHMSTFFAVAVFPRMPDDPGIRFAAVTLCRYAVLGLGLLCGLSSIHLGLEKIGVVLAALGVGLGFGLQEIVSNFVCGIILLLERPIRVGDIVTVGGQTGKVDRINIRATTIINGDNQSMIIPNRAFITGDLVNWTLKDKVVRVTIKVKVAHGSDPDGVADLLLAIARGDADVLRNPMPAAQMEEISDSALVFALYAHVPEPALAGRVKHRLFREIQRQFREAEITLALPTQELLFKPLEGPNPGPFDRPGHRADAPSAAAPRLWSTPPRPAPEPVEESHRGVDE